jgi:RNA polymerase sigma-70 factor (ECF subfamily)
MTAASRPSADWGVPLAGTPAVASPGSDETLADRARAGSRAAFVTLVSRYQDRIYRLALRMSHNPSDAEEITQEAFLRAYRAIASFHGDSRFGTWLYRIAMNEALMRRRSAMRRPLESLDALAPRFADVGDEGCVPPERTDELVDSKTIACRVHEALDKLDTNQRAALVLRDLEELTADEAAQVLGVSADVVRQRAHRARLNMRNTLADLLAQEGCGS